MAIAKVSKVLIAAGTQSTPGNSSKTAPSVVGTAVDCTTYYGGELSYRFTNGSAPSTVCNITFQASPDGTVWYDYYSIGGDTTGGSVNSGSIMLDRGIMWVRAIAFGNQTNAVTVEATLMAVTGV